MRIAVMQGRLLPPSDGCFQCFPRKQWRTEFPLAAEAGLDAIEWIYDSPGESENPLGSDNGLAEMHRLSEKSNIAVVSVCADYFMECPLVKVGASARRIRKTESTKLLWLLDRCQLAGITGWFFLLSTIPGLTAMPKKTKLCRCCGAFLECRKSRMSNCTWRHRSIQNALPHFWPSWHTPI